jgi:hypothetical protein
MSTGNAGRCCTAERETVMKPKNLPRYALVAAAAAVVAIRACVPASTLLCWPRCSRAH